MNMPQVRNVGTENASPPWANGTHIYTSELLKPRPKATHVRFYFSRV